MAKPKAWSAQVNLYLSPDMKAKVKEAATTADLSVSSWIACLIDGALRTGQADRLLEKAQITNIKRMPQPHQWKYLGTGERGATSEYGREGYLLSRLGHPGKSDQTSNGWFLTGPGIAKPQYLGKVVREARLAADQIVDQLLNERSVTE